MTLHPSIGNWGFPCRSHYLIRRNQVVWVRGMSDREISLVRERDRRDKETYIASLNRQKQAQAAPYASRTKSREESIFRLLLRAIAGWWK